LIYQQGGRLFVFLINRAHKIDISPFVLVNKSSLVRSSTTSYERRRARHIVA
jgi:hypothetical protein